MIGATASSGIAGTPCEQVSRRTASGSKALTAQIGQRSPKAGGYGQLVFFWAGRTFLGWDSRYEGMSILRLSGNGGHIIPVTCAHYAPSDPAYDPSLPPVTIGYRWRDGRLAAGATPPSLSVCPSSNDRVCGLLEPPSPGL